MVSESVPDKQTNMNVPYQGLIILGDETILYQTDLAAIFSRDPSSIWRAVERGELPPPIKLFGKNAWTAGSIIKHIKMAEEGATLDRESERAELKHKVASLRP